MQTSEYRISTPNHKLMLHELHELHEEQCKPMPVEVWVSRGVARGMLRKDTSMGQWG